MQTGRGGETVDKKKLLALFVPLMIVLATGVTMTVALGYAVTPVAAATSPTANITLMINDFMPAFFQIMIVMVFVLLLLVLVDRVARHI